VQPWKRSEGPDDGDSEAELAGVLGDEIGSMNNHEVADRPRFAERLQIVLPG